MAFVGLVVIWTGPALAEIYYRIDENGVIRFTNAPTTPDYRVLQPGILSAASRLTASSIDGLIEAFAADHSVDSALIRAVIQVESNFNRKAVSRKGAQGLMQLMPGTIWRLAVGDAFDPHENIGAGVRYLRQLLDLFQGDLTLTLAAYNAGENAVLRYRGVPPYQETRDYVRKVLNLYRRTRGEASRVRVASAAPRAVESLPPPPPPPPPPLYRAVEASGAILYSNIPPIVRSP
ncbi:MAG: lytic transglycosylase domain-containing protein [Candidatus Methylomirabilis oxyfera]|nr:lytic transglycosylase domain-containing protein [Candidatus Methylomirabilis oxyfera]